jgi:hypothetical protein
MTPPGCRSRTYPLHGKAPRGYEVWLIGDGGAAFPVGVLAPDGEGIWSLPADVAARFRAIDVTLERADGDPSRSGRTVLRGTYA